MALRSQPTLAGEEISMLDFDFHTRCVRRGSLVNIFQVNRM